MKSNYGQLMLEDIENQKLLGELILAKANLCDSVSVKILKEDELNDIIKNDLTTEGIYRIIDHYEATEEKRLLQRDISSMCYHYNKSRNIRPNDDTWDKAYEHATRVVQITDVVKNLLGEVNLNRNIKCPFHEDKSPSLKVYTKGNRFVCFGCQSRGSPIDFVVQYKNCSFREAVFYLHNM